MKKLATIVLMMAGSSLSALPLGNPSEASLHTDGVCANWGCVSLRAGFYGDYVFDRYLEVDGGGDIRDTELYTNAAYLAFNWCDRVDLFATVGASRLTYQTDMITLGNNSFDTLQVDIDSDTSFSWSVGGRATLWECCGFSLGVEGQYFRLHSAVNHIDTTGFDVVHPNQSLTYREWQVGLGASYFVTMDACCSAAIPYIGLMWSGSRVDQGDLLIPFGSNRVILFDLQNRKLWTYAVGVSLLGCGKSSLTFEGRFAGERAFYVNGQVRF